MNEPLLAYQPITASLPEKLRRVEELLREIQLEIVDIKGIIDNLPGLEDDYSPEPKPTKQ